MSRVYKKFGSQDAVANRDVKLLLLVMHLSPMSGVENKEGEGML